MSSSTCAKLRTVTGSNNRDHLTRSLYYCLFAPHIYFCSSRTSGSWWITQSTQHHRRGCNNIPSFLQRTTPIARSLCEGQTPHDLHILVTAPFCCDRKSRAARVQSFAPWQQATREITRRDHSIIACSRHIHIYFCSSRTSRSWWITQPTQHHRRGCSNSLASCGCISLINKPTRFSKNCTPSLLDHYIQIYVMKKNNAGTIIYDIANQGRLV